MLSGIFEQSANWWPVAQTSSAIGSDDWTVGAVTISHDEEVPDVITVLAWLSGIIMLELRSSGWS